MKFLTAVVLVVATGIGFHLTGDHPPHAEPPTAAAITTGVVPDRPIDDPTLLEHRSPDNVPDPAPADPSPPMATPHPAANVEPAATGAAPGCDGKVIPAYILQRESGCSYDAWNPGGCGGYGCVGLYQFDLRHFTGWANGQAACGDLDPWTAAGQDECADRLSDGGRNLAPWGA